MVQTFTSDLFPALLSNPPRCENVFLRLLAERIFPFRPADSCKRDHFVCPRKTCVRFTAGVGNRSVEWARCGPLFPHRGVTPTHRVGRTSAARLPRDKRRLGAAYRCPSVAIDVRADAEANPASIDDFCRALVGVPRGSVGVDDATVLRGSLEGPRGAGSARNHRG